MTEQYKIDTVSIILSEMLKESREQNITKGDFHKLPNKYAERIVKLFSIPDVSLPNDTFCECETPDEYYSSGLKYSVCFNCNKRISQNES